MIFRSFILRTVVLTLGLLVFTSCSNLSARRVQQGYTGRLVREYSRAPVTNAKITLNENPSAFAFMQTFGEIDQTRTGSDGFFALGRGKTFNAAKSFLMIVGSSEKLPGSRLAGGSGVNYGGTVLLPLDGKSGYVVVSVPEDFSTRHPSAAHVNRMMNQTPEAQAAYRRAEKYKRYR